MKKIKILLALQLRALFAASRRRQGKTRSAGIKVLMALAFLYVGGVMMPTAWSARCAGWALAGWPWLWALSFRRPSALF